MNLSQLGWKAYQKLQKNHNDSSTVARVTAENKTNWDIASADQTLTGIILNSYRQSSLPADLPKVGDFVVFEKIPDEDKAKIIQVLPRISFLARIKNDQQQILATNINRLFIVQGLDQDLNLSQLQRYVAMGVQGGAKVTIILNKIDLSNNLNEVVKSISQALPDTKLIQTSAKTKVGLEALINQIAEDETVVFVGLSGAGKSSLINMLLQEYKQETKQTREDGKGRHSTTKREMFILPNGGIVIDTPGIRTLEQDLDQSVVEKIFINISELATNCKFRNCDHIKSKGCAILDALANQEISQYDYDQFIKLSNQSGQSLNNDSLRIQQERRQKQKKQTLQYKKFLSKRK